jgi:hypothetical protein
VLVCYRTTLSGEWGMFAGPRTACHVHRQMGGGHRPIPRQCVLATADHRRSRQEGRALPPMPAPHPRHFTHPPLAANATPCDGGTAVATCGLAAPPPRPAASRSPPPGLNAGRGAAASLRTLYCVCVVQRESRLPVARGRAGASGPGWCSPGS